MDYSKLSDFEINKLVAELRGLGVSAEQYFEPERNQSNCVLIDNKIKPVDYCNNPSDAWSIILENKISLLEDGGEWEASIDYPCDIGAYGTTEICSKVYEDKNPLRCAMIVYLMMQEQ